MQSSKIRLLTIIPLADSIVSRLNNEYDVVYRPDGWAKVSHEDKAHVAVLITNGTHGLSSVQMDELPDLGLIAVFGAGYEGVDLSAARTRNVIVTHGPGVNDSTVADHAVALALALARDIPRRSKAVQAGEWTNFRAARPTLSGSTVGIVGLGHIGAKIAKRVDGFDAEVLYFDIAPRTGATWKFVPDVRELAKQSDFVFLACPGGPKTWHIVNADVLSALGPQGFLINTARGSVVDTTALINALRAKVIAGAALDVFETEPHIAPELLALENVVFTPHMAGRSPTALDAQTTLLLDNLAAFSEGQPPLTVVPELR